MPMGANSWWPSRNSQPERPSINISIYPKLAFGWDARCACRICFSFLVCVCEVPGTVPVVSLPAGYEAEVPHAHMQLKLFDSYRIHFTVSRALLCSGFEFGPARRSPWGKALRYFPVKIITGISTYELPHATLMRGR
jgi:hypothetical protein